jgi:antitoxin MazE
MGESENVRVGKKFTLVIPKSVRERLKIREGDILTLQVEGEKIVLTIRRSDPFKVLEQVIGEPYDEVKDEKEAERWLKENAGG